ncbi:gliding motility-associated C-terminal domain-containing protein [Spirosoma agri]|uniref:Gliding motility-associated C-terminal domain-containing protein n=1 Tax=Spirosoma agri TaxID=1987381 RepID=A0A6M0IQB0_9BACT|nr:gliding motility-associated C-terminal domain-containing protein [Spirosoma agri]NEU70499.1 gliding motility-associated C-terminal domain-containing protein [Spirosoma agri]
MARQSTWLLILALALFCIQANGQNLVPNGSFEQYAQCPQQDNLLSEAVPWYNPSRATPDFYHECFKSGQMALSPHTGQGLAHLFLDRGWSEYMAVPLLKPLEANQCYSFEMYVALETPNKLLPQTLGAYFSTQPVTTTTTELFAVNPQFIESQLTANTPALRWQRVSGSITAKGGEKYVTIGSFFKSPPQLGFYYLFIDDVSLLPVKLDLGRDTTLCGRASTYSLSAKTPGAIDYLWNDGTISPTLLVTKAGTYSVKVTTPCKILYDTISINYSLDFNLGPDTTLCTGQTLTLSVPSSASSTYSWQNGSSLNTFPVSQAGRYTVRVTQANCTVTDSIQVRYTEPPQLDLGQDIELCGAERFTIQPTVAKGQFAWQDLFAEQSRTVTNSGVFRATVRNECATVTDSIVISYGACDCVLYTPDSFTPNGDGSNDTFSAYGCGDISIQSLSVFNRWGELIFTTTTPPFQWDGYVQGVACPTGVYAWHIDYRLSQRNKVTPGQRQGSVYVLH